MGRSSGIQHGSRRLCGRECVLHEPISTNWCPRLVGSRLGGEESSPTGQPRANGVPGRSHGLQRSEGCSKDAREGNAAARSALARLPRLPLSCDTLQINPVGSRTGPIRLCSLVRRSKINGQFGTPMAAAKWTSDFPPSTMQPNNAPGPIRTPSSYRPPDARSRRCTSAWSFYVK